MKPATLFSAVGCALCVFCAVIVCVYFGAHCWLSNDAAAVAMGLVAGGALCCILLTAAVLLLRKAIR